MYISTCASSRSAKQDRPGQGCWPGSAVPVAGRHATAGPNATPTAATSRSPATTIGARWPKSGEFVVELGGDDDVLVVGRRLGAAALQPAARGLAIARVGIGEVDPAGRRRRRDERVGPAAEAPAVLHPAPGAIGLVGRVGLALRPQLLFQAALGLLQPLWPRRRDRPGLLASWARWSSSRRVARESNRLCAFHGANARCAHSPRPAAALDKSGNAPRRGLTRPAAT